MFTCDEEALQQHDSTFSNVSDSKDIDPDVLHSVLAFIDTNVHSRLVPPVDNMSDVKESLTTETTSSADIVSDATTNSDLDLRRTGEGIYENSAK